MNYYERHIGDYLKDTAHLSLLEHGVYTRLLDVYYTREEPLPAADVARLIGARSKEEREALQAVLREFFVPDAEPPTAWLQPRCEIEIGRYNDKRRKAKASADARWTHSERNANASANAMRTHSDGNAPTRTGARPSPLTSHQTPNTRHQQESPPAARVPPEPRSKALPCPEGVEAQVWADWLALRKAKKAPVTDTVLRSATTEAGKAGMTLDAFLRIWCARGSQGLQAEWLKPEERSPSRQTATDRRVTTINALTGKDRQHGQPTSPDDAQRTIEGVTRVVP